METIKLSEVIDDLIAHAKMRMNHAKSVNDNEQYWYWRGRFESYDQIKKSPLEY